MGLRHFGEYIAYFLAPHLDAHAALFAALATAALLVLLFAALVALPRIARIGFAAPVVATVRRTRMPQQLPHLTSRRVRAPSQPRAPALAL